MGSVPRAGRVELQRPDPELLGPAPDPVPRPSHVPLVERRPTSEQNTQTGGSAHPRCIALHPPFLEQVEEGAGQAGRQGHHPALAALRGHEPSLGEGSADRDPPPLEIDVSPREAERFGAARPGRQQETQQRCEARLVLLGHGQERLGLARRRCRRRPAWRDERRANAR
jgi:hypothetical protein